VSAIIEGGSALLCVQMAAISPAATLGIDVVVVLSVENGSGVCLSVYMCMYLKSEIVARDSI
jgi:hypothetical protein